MNNDKVELMFLRVLDHSLEVLSIISGCTLGFINVFTDKFKILFVATFFDEGQIYFLSNGEFIDNLAGNLPANKAYLLASEVGGSGGAIGLRFGDATMIKEVVTSAEDVIFDLLGRKVENPTKGIYIINGKKVLVK